MPQRIVYFNGSYVSERDARISIFDSALMFGDMVFEMTRSFKQKPYRLRNHLDRLYASMKYAEIECGLSIEEMEAATGETIRTESTRHWKAWTTRSCTTSPGAPFPCTTRSSGKDCVRSSPSTSSRSCDTSAARLTITNGVLILS